MISGINMDILLLKTTNTLGQLFPVVFIVVLATIFIFICINGKNKVKLAGWVRNILMIFAVFYIVLTFITSAALHKAVTKKFYSLASQNSMIIQNSGRTVEIKGQVAVSEFIGIVKESEAVSAHHSHPISQLRFDFPQTGYSYSIGRDSQNKNEFWLEWNHFPNRKENWDAQVIVKQFHSDKMADWENGCFTK